jgi:hypothetical protein
MCGRKKDAIAGRKEIATGGTSFASADEPGDGWIPVGSVDRHGVDLIAGDIGTLMLEDQLLVVDREVRFGVLAAKSQLANIS